MTTRYRVGQSVTVTTCPAHLIPDHTRDNGTVIGHPFHGRRAIVDAVRPQDFDLDRAIICRVDGEKGLLRFRPDELTPASEDAR